MKCPFCDAWSSVNYTRGIRRRRECANGHRFSTQETPVIDIKSRDREIAEAVVVRGMFMKDAATLYGIQSDSYVSRCVQKHFPDFNARSKGQLRRRRGLK